MNFVSSNNSTQIQNCLIIVYHGSNHYDLTSYILYYNFVQVFWNINATMVYLVYAVHH